MARIKKSVREKLNGVVDLPKIIKPKGKNASRYGNRMLVPAPSEIETLMKKVRKGNVITSAVLRDTLSQMHNATSTCPLTCGIFVWLISKAAQEAEDEGRKRVTPWWRTLKAKGELNPKYPGGLEEHAKRLRTEGHTIIKRGKRWFVDGIKE